MDCASFHVAAHCFPVSLNECGRQETRRVGPLWSGAMRNSNGEVLISHGSAVVQAAEWIRAKRGAKASVRSATVLKIGSGRARSIKNDSFALLQDRSLKLSASST